MAEQSVNVTLEQVTISRYKSLTSLSDLSAAEYEDEYSFLTDNSLSEEHVQISNVRLNPPQQNYQVRFYEIRNYDKLRNEPYMSQEQNTKHKIMSLNVKQKNNWEKVVCLPRSNHPIELQVQSKSEDILFGKIKQEENEIESQLFNASGQKVASLQYDLKLPNCKKDESRLSVFLGERQQTLHSADFESQSENMSRLKEISHEEKLDKIDQQLSDKLGKIQEQDQHKAEKITTMSTSSKIVRILRRRKKLQSLGEQESQIQQKGEQEYELDLQEKVKSYRNPFQKKQKYLAHQTKEVDFSSLQRSKEELGIPFVNFEDMIYPKSLRSKTQTNEQQEEQNQLIKILNPEIKSKTQSSLESHRISYQDCGVGTYTPLSTLKSTMKQSYNSFIQKNMRSHGVQAKIVKSANLKLEKLVQQKKRYEPQQQVKQSQYQEQSTSRSFIQKRSILKKFFMTNRDQEKNKLQSNHGERNRIKKAQIARQNLSVQNRVLEIKIQQFPKVDQKINKNEESISPISLQRINPRTKKSQSCRDAPQKIESQLVSLSDSQLYPEYNLTINNISLNFRRKTFGNKQLMIKLGDTGYLTEKIAGNNLMWASKSYRFQRVSQNDEIEIDVRGETTEHQFIFGSVKIAFNDLLINKKQRYYQTFLLGEKQVLGILILGYQIFKKKDSLKNYVLAHEQRRQYSQSETKRIEDQIRQTKKLKKLESYLNEDVKKKLPSPQANKIKIKKYLGGKNIKIGRASRFQDSSNILIPGPGEYQIESDFNRHALKQD